MRSLLDEIARRLADAPALEEATRLDARREARMLVAATLGCTTGDLARRVDRPVPYTERDRILAAVARRVKGEPLAYAVGTAPFRHMTLHVDARVLIPRPETETVVEEALRISHQRPGGIAIDIGTGSGAIALALATEGAFERIIGTDVSSDALDVARVNAALIVPSVPVEFRHGSDFGPLTGMRARVIVSNPPYIAYSEASGLPASVRDWEPVTALFAGDGGMARYDVLLSEAASYLEPGGFLVCEVDAQRAGETADRARRLGWTDVRLVRDLSGRDRVLVATASLPSPGPEAR